MKWISIKDELPPINTDVLVFTAKKNYKYVGASFMRVAAMYERMLSDYYETEESRKDILRWTCLDEVLFWMPLPSDPEQ